MLALQGSAVLALLVAIGFALPTPYAAMHLLREERLPSFFGAFPLYGGGFFDRLSHEWFVVALALFAATCAIDAFAAVLLWNGERLGAYLTVAMLPVGAVFWAGFALPIPPLLALVRVALLAMGWSALRAA